MIDMLMLALVLGVIGIAVVIDLGALWGFFLRRLR
jgi:hypothetical protein